MTRDQTEYFFAFFFPSHDVWTEFYEIYFTFDYSSSTKSGEETNKPVESLPPFFLHFQNSFLFCMECVPQYRQDLHCKSSRTDYIEPNWKLDEYYDRLHLNK